jgi:hypothetical protein
LVLLGRDQNEPDVGLAFHAHARAKNAAFALDGMVRNPFCGRERDERLECFVEALLEFAIYARRYMHLAEDAELREVPVVAEVGVTFGRALDRIVHAINFIPEYRTSDDAKKQTERDTLLVGVTVKTDKWPAETLLIDDLCEKFLEHSPRMLFEFQRQREDADASKRQGIAHKWMNRNE